MKKMRKLMILITLIFALSSNVFCYTVFAADDVTLLQAAHDNAEAAIATQAASPVGDPHYEADSYQAFIDSINGLGGLVGIQAVIDEPTSTQTVVDDLTTDINNALTALILDDTYYSTLANFSIANSIDLTPYTSSSQATYNNEMDRIEIILNTPTAGEVAIQSLNADITAASDLLILRGDKTDMNNYISQIEAIYITNGDDYLPSTFSNFKISYDGIDTYLTFEVGKTLQNIVDDIDSTVSDVQAAENRLNEILGYLVLRPDKTQLQSDYDTAAAIDPNLYTSSSFILFTAQLELIESVINDLEALDSDVVQAIEMVSDSYSILVLKGNVTDLLNAYLIAINQDLSSYTPESVVIYQSELTRINDIIVSDDTNQAEADLALSDLASAIDLLVLQADRSNLQILNNLLIDAYYEDSQLYTASSHNAFKTACEAFGSYLSVNQVIIDDNVTQTEVDGLEVSIQAALDLLVLLIDNSRLLTVYYDLVNDDLSGYTTNSQADYNDELDRIYQIIIGDEFDIATATQVLLDLSELDIILIELADYTGLQAAYDSTSIYREEDYSASSYSILIYAKTYAEYMLQNMNATQIELNDTIQLLSDSVETLEQTIETIYLRENNTIDILGYLTLATSTVIDYEIEDHNIISVDSSGQVEALNYGSTTITVNLSNGASEVITIKVEASLELPVYILAFSMPVVATGLASLVLFGKKETWLKFIGPIKNIFVKKK